MLLTDLHPDLLARCVKCDHLAVEHDAYDMACPDSDETADENLADQTWQDGH